MLNIILKITRSIMCFAFIVHMSTSLSIADALPTNNSSLTLTVRGSIDNKFGDGGAVFDLAMLQSLPHSTIRTHTSWTQGENNFEGVSLKDLLAAVGARGASLHASAINDYAVDIPIADAVEHGPIVAYSINGRPMSIRDKGPLWIIYPFDSDAQYRTEVIYSRSIWQLTTIIVTP